MNLIEAGSSPTRIIRAERQPEDYTGASIPLTVLIIIRAHRAIQLDIRPLAHTTSAGLVVALIAPPRSMQQLLNGARRRISRTRMMERH